MTPTRAVIDAIGRMQPTAIFVEEDEEGRARVVRLEADRRAAPGACIAAAITRELDARVRAAQTVEDRAATAEALDRTQAVSDEVFAISKELGHANARINAAAACGAISADRAHELRLEQHRLADAARARLRSSLLDLIQTVEGRR